MGDRSVMQMPTLVCGSSPHIPALIAGLALLLLAIAFYVMIVYACCIAPAMSASGDRKILDKVKFLIFRFRSDSWYFGCVLIPRGLFFSLVGVVFPDEPHAQMLAVTFI